MTPLTLPAAGRGTRRVAGDTRSADDRPMTTLTFSATPTPARTVRCECTYCGAHAHVHPARALGGRCPNCGCHLLRPLRLDHDDVRGLPSAATGGDHVTEEQARRVAGELHDGAMQEITLARLQLDLICAGIEDDALAEELVALSDALQDASTRLQALMRGLVGRPSIV